MKHFIEFSCLHLCYCVLFIRNRTPSNRTKEEGGMVLNTLETSQLYSRVVEGEMPGCIEKGAVVRFYIQDHSRVF